MPELEKIFSGIEEIYQLCQPMPIEGERCHCVSPTLTFAEFLYLLKGLKEQWPPEIIAAFALQKPTFSALVPGETDCPLAKHGECSASELRGMVCRVSDLPKSAGLEYKSSSASGKIKTYTSEEAAKRYNPVRDQLAAVNNKLHEFEAEPYFLDALTPTCWFAIQLDPGITQPFFINLRTIANSVCDLSHLAPRYENHTMLKEKIDAIDLFFSLNEQRMALEALECLKLIHNNFPATGSYFQPQAIIYARFLSEIVSNNPAVR